MQNSEIKISVIGLGYVGLPLAIEFSKKFKTIGYDINQKRINDLLNKSDVTMEVTKKELEASKNILFTSDESNLLDCNYYIVTVPTPIDKLKNPDLSLIKLASATIGKYLLKGDIVIYESTVYPGVTEEICAPILEKISKLKYNKDFFCGYSPERINPGDKKHRIDSIIKVVSGSNAHTLERVDYLYKQIIRAGTHRVSSIKVAEAAKIIENTQRDVNIALINEFAIIFNKLGLNSKEILDAAATKWNFLSFTPGLVGGHCIGVDPYYLTYKSKQLGYEPKVILAGRNTNDNMSSYVAHSVINLMCEKNIKVINSNILILGVTFKENCPDFRNTKILDIRDELIKKSVKVDIHDPYVSKKEFFKEYDLKIFNILPKKKYDAIIIAVAHDQYKLLTINDLDKLLKKKSIIYDVKKILPNNITDGSL